MKRLATIVFIFLCLFLIMGGIALSLETNKIKQVLILYSEERWHPSHQLTEKGIREEFESNTAFDEKVYAENLDILEFPTPASEMKLVDALRNKYGGMKIDIVITVYPAAFDFIINAGANLFPGVPIIASEVFKETAEKIEASPNRRFVTGTIIGDNLSGLLREILEMKPRTKHFALITGVTPDDTYAGEHFRKALISDASEIDLIDLSNLTMEETLSRVGSLPSHTAILYTSFYKDAADHEFVQRSALSLIAQRSNAPLFGLYETHMGYGIVGGSLVNFELQGRETGTLAIRVMKGESPASIPFGGKSAYIREYDWREIARWHIPETALPADSVVLFHTPSVWKKYRVTIFLTFLLLVIEGLLIGGLLMSLRMRTKASRFIKGSNRDLERLTRNLITTQEEELRHLSRELHDDLTQRLAGLAIEAGILEQRLKDLHAPVAMEISDLKMKLIDASENVHNLSRQLHPAILDDLGLKEAVESECRDFSRRTGIAVSFKPIDVPGSIPSITALSLYRIVQEGFKNIEKHANATQIQIVLQGLYEVIHLFIKDNGEGFDLNAKKNKAGLGLSSIRERISLINGEILIKSEIGKGTELDIFVPLGVKNE